MSNVGFATLTIIPSARGFAAALDGEVSPATKKTGEKASGSLISTIGGGALKVGKIAAGAVAAVGGIIGALSIKGGIARQLQIEDAQAKLSGLGHSTDSVKNIMDSALASVKGTAFGMGEAATAAAGATAAGIAPGQALTRVLSLMADSATIAGTDMASMGSIFNKVAASGKLQGDVIAQLQDAGVPVLQFVAKEMGVTAAEASKMASSGAIDFETFANAMESGLGGAAQRSGDTTRGALANMKAAFSRFGVTLSGPFVSQAKGAFALVMNAVDGLNALIAPVMEAFGTAFANVVGPALESAGAKVETFFATVGEATSGVYTLLSTGDFKPFAGLEEDSGVVSFILTVRETIEGVYSILAKGDFRPFAGLQEDSAIVDFLFNLRDTASQVLAAFAPFGPVIGAAFAALGPAIASVLPSISPLGLVFQALLPVLPQLAGLIGQLAATLATTLAATLTSIAPVLSVVASALIELLSGALVAVMPIVSSLLTTFSGILAAIVPVIGQLLAAVLPLVETLLSALVPVITSLVGAVLPPLAAAFSQIIAAVLPVVSTLLSALVPVLSQVIAAVLPVVTTIASLLIPIINALMPVVTTVFGVIVNVIKAAMQIVQGVIQVATGLISGNWSQVWTGLGNIVSGAWNLIKSVISGALAVVRSVISAALSLIRSIFSSGWNALTGVVSGAWNGITSAISSGVSSAVSFVSSLPGKILSALSGLGSLLVSVGSNMMQGLIDGAKSMAGRIAEAVLAPIRNAVDGVKSFLGIHSPSRLFRSIGEFTGEGMAIGLERSAPLIERASDALIPKAPHVPAPTVGSGGVAGALAQAAGRSGSPLIYNAAPNQSLDSESALWEALDRKKGFGW